MGAYLGPEPAGGISDPGPKSLEGTALGLDAELVAFGIRHDHEAVAVARSLESSETYERTSASTSPTARRSKC